MKIVFKKVVKRNNKKYTYGILQHFDIPTIFYIGRITKWVQQHRREPNFKALGGYKNLYRSKPEARKALKENYGV